MDWVDGRNPWSETTNDHGVAVERARERCEEAPDPVVHVLDGPVGLGRARPVEVLEAVRRQEVDEEQVRRVAREDVHRHVRHHRVLHEPLRELRPFPLAVHGKAERAELGPDVGRGLGLEHALVLEERKVPVERRRMARGGPVDRGGLETGIVRPIADRGHAQERRRVVDRIAGQVLHPARLPVQDVVAGHAVSLGADAGDEAHVGRPRRRWEHRLHPGRDDPALREPAKIGDPRARIPPVESREPVDADHDGLRHGSARAPAYTSRTRRACRVSDLGGLNAGLVPCTVWSARPKAGRWASVPARNSSALSGTSMLRNRPAAGPATRGHHEEGEHVPAT